MKVRFRRPYGFDTLGQKYLAEAKKHLTVKITKAVNDMHRSILQTPVYTGRTLVNYHWSVGAPVETVRRPVPNPSLPGKTADLPIGSEPRRQAQEIVIQFEVERLLGEVQKDPLRHFYLTNTAPGFLDVEYGTYRAGARTPPGGMTRRGESLVTITLGAPRG